MQKLLQNGAIPKVGIFHVFGFFSYMEAWPIGQIHLMVDYLHIEGLGPTDFQEKLLAFLSRFEKWLKNGHFSGISQRNLNFTTCKFVSHSPTLAVRTKIMPDHPEKCQKQKHIFFRNPENAPIWPLGTP